MIGGALYQGNSGLVAGPLGVVKVGFNGFDMGKTTADATLEVVQNIKDIAYQQDGTMPADKVRTGIIYQVKVMFGEISTGLLAQVMDGFEQASVDPLADAAVLTRSMYQSMRDNESAPLRIASVDSNGVESDLDKDVYSFYTAIANIDGALINWGADTQRGVSVTFDIYWRKCLTGESSTRQGAFGYYGDPASFDLPAVVWPDRIGPYVLTATVDTATAITLNMSEKCAVVGGVTAIDRIIAIVDGDYVAPTVVAVEADPNDDTVTLTVPAITTGQTVLVCLLAGVLEDLETVPNLNARVVDFTVTNNI